MSVEGQTHDSTAWKWKLKEESLTHKKHHGLIKLTDWPQRCVWGHWTWSHWPHYCCWLTAVWCSAMAKFNWTFCRRFCGLAPHLCVTGKIPLRGIDAKWLLRKSFVTLTFVLASGGDRTCTENKDKLYFLHFFFYIIFKFFFLKHIIGDLLLGT